MLHDSAFSLRCSHSRESFLFWLEENGLPLEEYDRDTRYIAIQFVEIGGDHLDRIVSIEQSKGSDALGTFRLLLTLRLNSLIDADKIRVIGENSVSLLKKTKKTLYFANVETLLEVFEENGQYVARFNEANLKLFIQRLSFLSRVFSDQIGTFPLLIWP